MECHATDFISFSEVVVISPLWLSFVCYFTNVLAQAKRGMAIRVSSDKILFQLHSSKRVNSNPISAQEAKFKQSEELKIKNEQIQQVKEELLNEFEEMRKLHKLQQENAQKCWFDEIKRLEGFYVIPTQHFCWLTLQSCKSPAVFF